MFDLYLLIKYVFALFAFKSIKTLSQMFENRLNHINKTKIPIKHKSLYFILIHKH